MPATPYAGNAGILEIPASRKSEEKIKKTSKVAVYARLTLKQHPRG
jgi:hypothetical protein